MAKQNLSGCPEKKDFNLGTKNHRSKKISPVMPHDHDIPGQPLNFHLHKKSPKAQPRFTVNNTVAMTNNATKTKPPAKADVGFSTPKPQNDAPTTFSAASIPSFNCLCYDVDSEESVIIPYDLQLAWSEE